MESFSQIRERAVRAGCAQKIESLQQLAHDITSGEALNIAVLGGTNSGKTSLINQLAGSVVRKPTILSGGEPPLLVTFSRQVKKEGFDTKVLSDPERAALNFALYEIPLPMAILVESATPSNLLETMDFVIYVVSAPLLFTAEDVRNLSAIANRLPYIVVVSKLSMLPDEEAREQALNDIDTRFREHFGNGVVLVMDPDGEQTFAAFKDLLTSLPLADLRDAHLIMLTAKVNQIIRNTLTTRLNGLKAKKQLLAIGSQEAERAREQQLALEALGENLTAKQQDTRKRTLQRFAIEQKSLEAKLMLAFSAAGKTEEWVLQKLAPMIRAEMKLIADSAEAFLSDIVDDHFKELVHEVENKLGILIELDDVPPQPLFTYTGKPELPEKNQVGNGKITLAICSAVIAVGALIISFSIPITWIFAIPAIVTTAAMVKFDQDDRNKYREELRKCISKYCQKAFENLLGNISSTAIRRYQFVIDTLQGFSSDLDPQSNDFSEIYKEEKSILEQLKQCDIQVS